MLTAAHASGMAARVPSNKRSGHAALWGSNLPTAPSAASVHQRFSSTVVRAVEEDVVVSAAPSAAAEPEALAGVADLQVEEISGFAPAAAPAASGRSFFEGFPLSQGQEVINARAAMAGFVAAVVSEAWTQKSVWTQIAGRYRNGDLITHGNGTASLLFGAVVALLSYATLAPYFLKGETNTSRSFGPFTPSRERDVGRVAMMGFALLLAVETARGGMPVF